MCFDEELFDEEYGVGGKVIDDTQITTTILYFSQEERKQFAQLCKSGIKKEFGAEYQQRGNLSDFLLLVLKRSYGSEDNAG